MLPYTAEVLYALMGAYNLASWPAQPIIAALALAALALAFRPLPGSDRLIAAGLVAAWAWVGLAWHLEHFAVINFAAPVYAGLFLIEALALGWTGALRGRIAFRFKSGPAGWGGLGLAGAGLALLPLAHEIAGPGWPEVPLIGLAPGPTTLFTLGLLLLAERRLPRHLLAVPLLWCLIAGISAWPLALYPDFLLLAAAPATLAIALRRKRNARF